MNQNLCIYRGDALREISFPLGGLGTGSIGLAGNGGLRDWEIRNAPNKNGLQGMSHFAVRAERAGRVLDARVIQGDCPGPWMGYGPRIYAGFGYGPDRGTLAGLPHFRRATFSGRFPVAEVDFEDGPGDRQFPGQVRLRAFNPFIPLKAEDSGLPGAFFEIEVRNLAEDPLDFTVAALLAGPSEQKNRQELRRDGNGHHLIWFGSDEWPIDDPRHGEMALATDATEVSAQTHGFPGMWFDQLEVWWRNFTTPGPLRPREAGDRHGALAAHRRLDPGAGWRIRYLISWSFPWRCNDWSAESAADAERVGLPNRWRNYYGTCWAGAAEVAEYGMREWDRLWRETEAFRDALWSTTVPGPVLEAAASTLSVLKSPTVLRLEDGTFYGWEGCHSHSGSCEGSCEHVWNYAYAVPFLFPALERSMREAALRFNQSRHHGGLAFRLRLPLGLRHSDTDLLACADGHFGVIVKMYRDWKISGDTAWLRAWWPQIRSALEFAWHPENPFRWDPEGKGLLSGRQHHTLDMELFSPNAWLHGFYLAALKAGAEMAQALGEPHEAYRRTFEQGQAWAEAHLFNGEYYEQRIDLGDRSLLDPFLGGKDIFGGGVERYWDAEHGEVKYQMGEGCAVDQVVAQWHAWLMGLGDIFSRDRVESAARAIYRHNFVQLRDVANACRIYGGDDDRGTLICAWPIDKRRPVIPAPYSTETMHGFEYAAAGLLMQCGLVEEGVELVKGVRDRYDGARRNPWNEIECGSNYARSMASFALIPILAGFEFDMTRGMIGFRPRIPLPCQFLWALDAAWGVVRLGAQDIAIDVRGGCLVLRAMRLPESWTGVALHAQLGDRTLPVRWENGEAKLDAIVPDGETLVLRSVDGT